MVKTFHSKIVLRVADDYTTVGSQLIKLLVKERSGEHALSHER